MTTIVNLPALPSVNNGDVLAVDQSPTGNFQTGKATIAQLLARIPTASPNTPGLVQVGNGLTITNGILAATGGGGGGSFTLPIASASVLGGVKVGNGLQVDSIGTLSTTGVGTQYTLPIASTGVLGGIKPDGTTLVVNANTGVISVNSTLSAANPIFTGDITSTTAGAGLLLGSTSATGAPHIDFKSAGVPNTYDARITATGGTSGSNGGGTVNILATGGLQVNGVAITPGLYAPLNSAALTGTPTSTTPTNSDNSTRIATTAFVYNQVASAAVVTSLQGDGAVGSVMVDAGGTPSIQNTVFFPAFNLPVGQLVGNQVFTIVMPFPVTIVQFNAGVYDPGGTTTTNNVVLRIQKDGEDIPGLGAVSANGLYQAYHPTAPSIFNAGQQINYRITSVNGTMNADAVLNIQPFGTYA